MAKENGTVHANGNGRAARTKGMEGAAHGDVPRRRLGQHDIGVAKKARSAKAGVA